MIPAFYALMAKVWIRQSETEMADLLPVADSDGEELQQPPAILFARVRAGEAGVEERAAVSALVSAGGGAMRIDTLPPVYRLMRLTCDETPTVDDLRRLSAAAFRVGQSDIVSMFRADTSDGESNALVLARYDEGRGAAPADLTAPDFLVSTTGAGLLGASEYAPTAVVIAAVDDAALRQSIREESASVAALLASVFDAVPAVRYVAVFKCVRVCVRVCVCVCVCVCVFL